MFSDYINKASKRYLLITTTDVLRAMKQTPTLSFRQTFGYVFLTVIASSFF